MHGRLAAFAAFCNKSSAIAPRFPQGSRLADGSTNERTTKTWLICRWFWLCFMKSSKNRVTTVKSSARRLVRSRIAPMISYEVDDRQFDKYYSSITKSQLPLRCSNRASNHRNRRSARPGDTRFSRNGHRYCRLAVYRRFRELGPGQSPAWTLRSTPANELVTAVGATDEAQPVADLRADVLGHRRRAACLLPFGPVNHCW